MNRHRLYSIILSLLLFISVLIILMSFYILKPSDVKFPDPEGIVVNFGFLEEAEGDIEEISANNETKENLEEVIENENNSNFDNENYITDNKSKNFTVKKKERKKEKPKPKPKPKALFPGKKKTGSQGTSKGAGNQGYEEGDKNSNIYGKSKGSGISYSLNGRNAVYLPKSSYPGNESGKIVVEIVVNRNGNVVQTRAGIKGTTTYNTALHKAAKQAAMKTKFSSSQDAPFHQKGYLVYNFYLR